MIELYEITMKKVHPYPNLLKVYQLTISFEGLSRLDAITKADEIATSLGLTFDMNYVIRGYREEG